MAAQEARAARKPEADSSRSLLLPADTKVTCPECDSTFSLAQGFARASLEQFAQSTAGALEEVRTAERAEAARHAQQVASQQSSALRGENGELRRLLKEQGEKHAGALKEVAALAQQSQAP